MTASLAKDPTIDVIKGIGIISVVIGHSTTGGLPQWLYYFHMPLFFVLSGILSKPGRVGEGGHYLKKKWYSLMVPYFSWLLLFNAINLAGAAKNLIISPTMKEAEFYGGILLEQLYGGSRLTADKSVFWFVTCLFLTQQINHVITMRLAPRRVDLLMTAFLAIAWMDAKFDWLGQWPWSAEVCFYALPLYHIGQRVGRGWLNVSPRTPVGIFSIAVAVASAAWVAFGTDVVFDMQSNRYGFSIISLLIATGICTAVFILSRSVARKRRMMGMLTQIGAASMTIMFVHQIIKHPLFWRFSIYEPLVACSGVIAVAMVVHLVISQGGVGRQYFLGHPSKYRLASLPPS